MSAPYTPQNVVLQTGNSKNLVTWDLVVGATSYSVGRSLDGITFVVVATPASPSYLDSAVSVGVEYYYQVASVNASGISSYATPQGGLPVSIVPCLPGQMNLGYIRYLSQLRADKLNSQYLTLDEWNSNINQSMFELADILTTKFGDDYFMAPLLTIPLNGSESYPLPDGSNYSGAPAIYKLVGVDANISGGGDNVNSVWVPLPRFNWVDRNKYTVYGGNTGTLNNVFQAAYREMGQSLFIIPRNLNQLIRLSYVPIQSQLLQDTDMLPFSFSGWSEYIIVDAAMKAMVKEESFDKWTALNSDKQLLIARIETTAANRDVGQPNSVSNTRATMGDIGFGGWGNGGNGSMGGFW